ncbi:hypothetical protein [Roseomonas sp. CECT 9278]|uniref:hypothetical protein n=1 Tax=Roseomonas sp. CECT 9278 TaxID=2845823 RepID=UPI001E45D220|nr:hypothetical protein [Roseomonas sp. CECT 9278]CAH0131865.1 hypothetical protein ROS9278_00259 [Roseomonas sp. CECT 9278]
MTTRRDLAITAAATAALLAAPDPAGAQTAPAAEASGHADFLFVQTARRMSFDRAASRLTLHDVSPITLFFSDRPDRIAGNMRTAAFVPFWSQGRDSFLSDPPNADLSILEGAELRQVVVVLRDPVLQGGALAYGVQVLSGTMPAAGEEISVFIDIIGMPRTPVSFAGAARRGYRRAWMR